MKFTTQVLLLQHRLKLIYQLFQKAGEIDAAVLQGDVGEIEPGDLKEVIDQIFQSLRLAEGDGKILRPELLWKLSCIPQQIQIADDRSQRRLQIMGKIHDEIVFPLLRLLQQADIIQRLFPRQIDLIFHIKHLFRESDGILPGMGEALRRIDDIIQIPQRFSYGNSSNNKKTNR